MPIGFICATSAKYEQKATLLRPEADLKSRSSAGTETPTESGGWVTEQHPITGQPIRKWVDAIELVDDPDTPDIDESVTSFRFTCQARSIITGGLNSQGTTQRWTSKGDYENVDFVELQVPKDVLITKRDKVTNITDSRGNVIWKEEEYGRMTPTVFNVRGVAPSVDPFGHVVEQFVLLERSEAQYGEPGVTP